MVGVMKCPMKTSISETTFGSIAVLPIPSSRNRFIVNDRRVFQCGKGAHSKPTEIETKRLTSSDTLKTWLPLNVNTLDQPVDNVNKVCSVTVM